LVMPEGASAWDLFNSRTMVKYVADNAQSWYEYIIHTRGRVVGNGDIRLAVGCDKVSSWGIATFANEPERHVRLEFKAVDNPCKSASQTYLWSCDGGSGRVGPQEAETRDLKQAGDSSPLQNQCTFLRTMNVTLSERTWYETRILPKEIFSFTPSTYFDIPQSLTSNISSVSDTSDISIYHNGGSHPVNVLRPERPIKYYSQHEHRQQPVPFTSHRHSSEPVVPSAGQSNGSLDSNCQRTAILPSSSQNSYRTSSQKGLRSRIVTREDMDLYVWPETSPDIQFSLKFSFVPSVCAPESISVSETSSPSQPLFEHIAPFKVLSRLYSTLFSLKMSFIHLVSADYQSFEDCHPPTDFESLYHSDGTWSAVPGQLLKMIRWVIGGFLKMSGFPLTSRRPGIKFGLDCSEMEANLSMFLGNSDRGWSSSYQQLGQPSSSISTQYAKSDGLEESTSDKSREIYTTHRKTVSSGVTLCGTSLSVPVILTQMTQSAVRVSNPLLSFLCASSMCLPAGYTSIDITQQVSV